MFPKAIGKRHKTCASGLCSRESADQLRPGPQTAAAPGSHQSLRSGLVAVSAGLICAEAPRAAGSCNAELPPNPEVQHQRCRTMQLGSDMLPASSILAKSGHNIPRLVFADRFSRLRLAFVNIGFASESIRQSTASTISRLPQSLGLARL